MPFTSKKSATDEMAGVAIKPNNPKTTQIRRLSFNGNTEFQVELRRRVEEYFDITGEQKRDIPRMYLKSAAILLACTAFYVLLVFAAQNWWQGAVLSVLLGGAMALVGFNVMHDGGHDAYSESPRINKLMATALDLIGGSSYLWRWKHSIIHHTYPNITGYDSDIELSPFGRLSPHQPLYFFHRWQHIYLWPLYGLLAIKWHFYDDFHDALTGKIGPNPVPRPKGRELAIFLSGKVIYFFLACGLPLLLHPWWVVLVFYIVTDAVLGFVMAVVFQMAHAVEDTNFPLPSATSGKIEQAWAVHQVDTTVDFARSNKFLSWMVGGLNFQVEHHLFPRICHVNYPALSKIVEETCADFGIQYNSQDSFWGSLQQHYRWLRRMGQPAAG